MELDGRIALVTGARRNIGRAVAEALAADGAHVLVHGRRVADVADVADAVGGEAVEADLADAASVAALFADVGERHGRLDVLVNSAARTLPADLEHTSLEDFNGVLAVNCTAVLLCIQHALPLLRAAGGGAIVNVTASSGEAPSRGRAAYSISKGALNALTRQAAVELAPDGIRVNAVVSGIVGTPVGRDDMGGRGAEDPRIPMGRIGRPEEVAAVVAFLASPRASYVTNAFVAADGGRMNSRL